MSEQLSTESYKGVRDFYPDDWAHLNAIFESIRKIASLWGYEEYNASPLERAELYEAKTSEEIVNEQTYSFTDRGERRVTLRPEMTPTLARMVADKRRELAFPLRWFSIGNRFRYERPQNLREFYQADIDFVGLPEGEADIEIVQLASALLKNFGAVESDFVIRMNSRTLLNAACNAAGLTGDGVRHYLHLLDKKSKMTPDAFISASQTITEKDPLSFIESSSENSDVAIEKNKLLDRIESLKARGVGNIISGTRNNVSIRIPKIACKIGLRISIIRGSIRQLISGIPNCSCIRQTCLQCRIIGLGYRGSVNPGKCICGRICILIVLACACCIKSLACI